MYLSRLMPNLRSRTALAALANAYEMHRDIMSAFPDDGDPSARKRFGVLHRVDAQRDPLSDGRVIVVLVQSAARPVWSKLRPDSAGNAWARREPEQKQFDLSLHCGQRLRFRLRANPVKRTGRSNPDPKWVGKRVALVDAEEQAEWLSRQGTRWGFALLRVTPRPNRPEPVYNVVDRPEGRVVAVKNERSLTHYAVTFDGLLEVADPGLLTQAVASGIGPAKAFGFGLLSVAPVR